MTVQEYRYQSPPNWPAPPDGWTPPDGWRPPADWPAPPEGWRFWVPLAVDVSSAAEPAGRGGTLPAPTDAPTQSGRDVPLFGARKRARELATSIDALSEENGRLRAELERTGALGIVRVQEELAAARQAFADEQARLEQERAAARDRFGAEIANLTERRDGLTARVADLGREVVQLEETAVLQEVGVYEYHHPLASADAYKDRLAELRRRIKAMAAKDGGAIEADTSWTVQGSAAKGRRMVEQTSKLMLRAYNAEAESLVRALKPHRLAASVEKLRKTALQIERLGTVMTIQINDSYERLRTLELELVADYLAKVEEEKEATRAAREALREQRKVEQEMARAREKLQKEWEHYANAMAAMQANGDAEAVARLQAQLADVERAIEDVDYRAANQRAGYVYVISNIGAFGEHMIKVGMTRRLDPMDRVRELGDASVPFNFDVHTIFFSEDAVGIEAEVHRRLADRRVNRINLRREYFYATPHDALEQLRDLAGEVLTFEELPEAIEFRQSVTLRDSSPS